MSGRRAVARWSKTGIGSDYIVRTKYIRCVSGVGAYNWSPAGRRRMIGSDYIVRTKSIVYQPNINNRRGVKLVTPHQNFPNTCKANEKSFAFLLEKF